MSVGFVRIFIGFLQNYQEKNGRTSVFYQKCPVFFLSHFFGEFYNKTNSSGRNEPLHKTNREVTINMKRRWKLTAAAAILAALGLTACSQQESASAQSSGASQEGTQLVFAWWGNQVRNERTQSALQLYSEENPGVTFDGQFSEVADYWNKIATAAAGHALPDIIQMDYKYLQQYVNNGLLVDLTPYIENGTINTENCNQDVLNSAKVGDGIYAICNGINAPMLVYNKTLLDGAGITVKDNMTIDEFTALCKEIYEKTGYKTNIAYNNDDNYIEYYLRGRDVVMYEDGKMGGTAEDYVEFFKLYENGIAEGWMLDPSVFAERSIGGMEQDCMVYGSSPETMSWCALIWSNQMAAIESAAPEGMEIGISTWPAIDGKKSNYLKPSQFFSITVDSANPDEAAKVLDYFTNSVECNNILLAERGIPLSSAVADEISPNLDEANQKVIEYINELITPNSSPVNPPAGDGSSEVIDLINQLQEKVCYGEMTAEEAGEELFTQGTQFLSSK